MTLGKLKNGNPSEEEHKTALARLGQSHKKIKRSILGYEGVKERILEQWTHLMSELNLAEVQWLELCNLEQQSKATRTEPITTSSLLKPRTLLVKSAESHFKDAAELNAVPLPLKLEHVDMNLATSCDIRSVGETDYESSDQE